MRARNCGERAWFPRTCRGAIRYTKQAKSSLNAADKKALRTAIQIIKQYYQQ